MNASQILRIMVTDINHHVMDFLKRELENEGYIVSTAESSIEIYHCICNPGALDVIIFDPEVLAPYDNTQIGNILKQNTSTHFIIHTYDQPAEELKVGGNIHVVEKDATSIGLLKEKIRWCFQREADD